MLLTFRCYYSQIDLFILFTQTINNDNNSEVQLTCKKL